MEFLNTDFFKTLSVFADILTLVSLIYATIYGIINKSKTLSGFVISNFLSGTFKAAIILFILIFLFKLCDNIYLISIVLIKGNSNNYQWEKGYELHHLAAYFIYFAFFTTISWILGTFIWTSSFNQSRLFFNRFLPKERQLALKHFKSLTILSAKYGANESYIDVTEKLRKMIEKNTLTISSSNSIAGDPIFGIPKNLKISYRFDGDDIKTIEISEGLTETIKPH